MTYQVKLPVFEGPFDALFYLIQKAEVDIYEIPLARITDEYLEYLARMEELNLEIASEFLVMAATLLKLKSQRLLPQTRVEEAAEDDLFADITSQEDLIARMLEYKKFQEVARELRQIEDSQKRVFIRTPEGREMLGVTGDTWEGEEVPLSSLFSALRNLLNTIDVRVEEIDPERYSVMEIMEEIAGKIRRAGGRGLEFSALFAPGESRTKVILMFFALLELIRRKKVKVWQEKNFSMIYIQSWQEGLPSHGVARDY
jgi:segregation and condensation protein A